MANQQRNWLPIVASVGIGAAAYYSMKRGSGMGNLVQKFGPLMTGMGGQNQSQQNQQTSQLQ
ncbi:hypothetical protein [Salinibacillus xinjiangensis]|uniref:hypothetical protein n=1 Tax=Salinibacillus xinjiangensis TaxID=1229268 RepID=UPI001E4BB84B|nr:hypothetical protein [Salinibacillus xinjiangensis]